MTPADVIRIEQALRIELPAAYRQLLEGFPLPAYVGNSDTAVWDDADHLIRYNQDLRNGAAGVSPWPVYFYALGRDAGGCSQAIDLRTVELWWADRSDLDGSGSYKHSESLEQWAAAYFEGLREDLVGDGGDPSGTPEERAGLEEHHARESARLWGRAFLLLLLMGSVAVVWRVWRR